MVIKLPRSLQKEFHPIDEEVAHVKKLTPEERLHMLALACEASRQILAINEMRDKILSMRDPLPESTIVALRRLRCTNHES